MAKRTPNMGTEFLLEQYKLYVEMTDRLSARRNDASKFYTSLLTALLAIPFILGQDFPMLAQRLTFLGIGCLGLALCLIWVLNINSYKQLASLKFKVIHEMEQDLPFECYQREWEILGTNYKKYRRLNKVESYVPLLFGLLFLIIIVVSAVVLISP